MRLTVNDVATKTRIPQVLGLCGDNIPGICSYLNEAQQRLIPEGGETGWYGTWAKVAFSISCTNPYLSLPSEFARFVGINICRNPIRIENEWYQYLEAGVGLQTTCSAKNGCGAQEAVDQGLFPTAYDLASNQYIRVYYTDARDVGQQITFFNALDQNGVNIYSQNGLVPVNGFFLTLQAPFATTTFIVTKFFGISKPATYGDIVVKQVDATSGAESLLARVKASETNPVYRRYLLSRLPGNCCGNGTSTTVQITTLAKYEWQPVANPSDFLLIGNVPALKAECESIRYSEMDVANAAELSEFKHRLAIKRLNEELTHYQGKSQPAVNVAPFGTARLERVNLAMT